MPNILRIYLVSRHVYFYGTKPDVAPNEKVSSRRQPTLLSSWVSLLLMNRARTEIHLQGNLLLLVEPGAEISDIDSLEVNTTCGNISQRSNYQMETESCAVLFRVTDRGEKLHCKNAQRYPRWSHLFGPGCSTRHTRGTLGYLGQSTSCNCGQATWLYLCEASGLPYGSARPWPLLHLSVI